MSVEEFEVKVGVTVCPDDYGYEYEFNAEERIIELELDAINGNIPTWYAYSEIDKIRGLK